MRTTGIAIALMCALGAGAFTIREYKMAPAYDLRVPLLPDSVQKENPFKPEQLLQARHLSGQWPEDAGWTTMLPDSAGHLTLVTPKSAPRLNTFSTRIRAERFAKGQLKLKSTSCAEVLVNGDVTIKKHTSDSVATEALVPFSLNPSADYHILVNILGMPDDKSAPEFSVEFVPDEDFADIEIAASPNLERRVSPLSTMLGERVASVSLSPDGTYLLTKYRETLGPKETLRRAVITETATGRVITESVVQDSYWMSNSNTLCYTQRGVKDYDLYAIDIPSMRTKRLATAIPDADPIISPDDKYMVYYKKIEGQKEDGIMRRIKNPDDRIPGDRDRYYLIRYDFNSGVETILTYGGATTSLLDFTRDGSKMLYSSSFATPSKYPFYKISLIEMDMTTYATDTIVGNADGYISEAYYSPSGKQLFVIGGPDAFDGVGANYAPHEIGNNYDGQGYILDIATRKVRAVTRDFNPALHSSPVWNAVNGLIYFRGERGFYNDIYSLDPSSGKITRLPTEVPNVRSFSLGDNEARWLAYCGGGFTEDGSAYILDLKSGKSLKVATPHKDWLGDTKFGEMEPWKFTASDGTEVDGFMCLPPDFDADKKYPLIVYYYGGTSPSQATFYHLYSPQVFASRGYVVYVLNPSGTTGYGQEYSARHVNAWGKRTADEIIEGVKLFCKAHPFVNDKKIGCLGASYGGFMTQYLLTKTDIFAAAMSHAGISNVTSYWGEGYWGYSYNSVAAAKHYPWSDPELFTQQGSLFNADKIHTPLLLLHGTVDTNVPIGESIQIFNALKILGREVEFITVQDENHVISGFEQKLEWQNTIMAWFAKWLQDDPRWWNELYK